VRVLFQRFLQGVGRADRHAVGVVDQTDFSLTDERTYMIWCSISRLANLDLPGGLFRVRLDDEKSPGMRVGFDLLAGPAGTTTVETVRFGRLFAVERLREANARQSLSNRLLAVEQIGVSQALIGDGGLQEGDGLLIRPIQSRKGMQTPAAWRATRSSPTILPRSQ